MSQFANGPRKSTAVPVALSALGLGALITGPLVANRIGQVNRMNASLETIGEADPLPRLATEMNSRLPQSTKDLPVLVDWLADAKNREGRASCVGILEEFALEMGAIREELEELGFGFSNQAKELAGAIETAEELTALLREFNEREPLTAQRDTTYLVKLLGQRFESFKQTVR